MSASEQLLGGINDGGPSYGASGAGGKPQALQGTAKLLVMLIGVALLVGAWVAEGEVTQSLLNPTSGTCGAACSLQHPASKRGCNSTCGAACYACCSPAAVTAPGVGPRPFLITYCARLAWSSTLLLWGAWYVATGAGGKPGAVVLGYGARHYAVWLPVLAAVVAACAYTWFISLHGMPVSANTAVYNTTPVFVFVLSVPLLGEAVTAKKVLATLSCVLGVAVVAFSANAPACPGGAVAGGAGAGAAVPYLWCLGSVLLYALYEVGVKKCLQHPDETYPVANSLLLLGSLGLVSVLLFWPVFYALGALDPASALHEPVVWPTGPGLRLLVINSCLDMLFNLALILIIAVTSPLVASVASIITIPASGVSDFLIKSVYYHDHWAYSGIVLIGIGFVLMATDGSHGGH